MSGRCDPTLVWLQSPRSMAFRTQFRSEAREKRCAVPGQGCYARHKVRRSARGGPRRIEHGDQAQRSKRGLTCCGRKPVAVESVPVQGFASHYRAM
jgi:hypothetical protein